MIIAYHMFGLRGMSNDVYGRESTRKEFSAKRATLVHTYYQGCCGLSTVLSLSFYDSRHFVARRESIHRNLSTTINSVEVEAHNSKWNKPRRFGFIVISVTATGNNSKCKLFWYFLLPFNWGLKRIEINF